MADVTISNDSAHTYGWTAPTAVRDGLGNLYTAQMTSQGQARIFKENGGTVQNKIVQTLPEADDHNNPCLSVQAGKDVIAFWTRHNKDAKMRFARAPEGTKDFGSVSEIIFPGNITYAQLMEYGDVGLLLTRVGNNAWWGVLTDDHWDSHGDPFKLVEMTGAGSKMYMCHGESSTPGVFHIALYGHPSLSSFRNIMYGKINLVDMTVEKSAGVIADLPSLPDHPAGISLPLNITDFDIVWSPGMSDQVARLFAIGEAHGKPVVLYAKWWDDVTPRYYRARQLDDGSWSNLNLQIDAPIFAYRDAAKYIGGGDFARNGQNYLALSVRDSATNKWHIKKYTINADSTFSLAGSFVNSSLPLVRPLCPRGDDCVTTMQLVDYSTYGVFQSKILECD